MAAPAPCDRRRRSLLLGAAAVCAAAPHALLARPIFTPADVAQQFEREVDARLRLTDLDTRLYAGMAELQLACEPQALLEPQFMLVVDRNPCVQAALLMWRLAPGCFELLGAAPASTGGPVRRGCFETPQGAFEQASSQGHDSARICDFGWQRARPAQGGGKPQAIRLLARAADPRSARRLGSASSDGSVLLPGSLMRFLDRYALLDGDQPMPAAAEIPYRGRVMLVIDSEREDRPEWSPKPA